MESKFELFEKKAFAMMRRWCDVKNVKCCRYELILESGLGENLVGLWFWACGEGYYITEIRLRPWDVFVCGEWGLYLLNTDGPVDTKFREHTFPDRNYFDKQTADEATVFYNGNLKYIINNEIILTGVRTDIFRRDMSVDSRRELEMAGAQTLVDVPGDPLVLWGHKNTSFLLDLPRKSNLEGSQMRVRLRLRGLLFMNATIVT
jgi:hypothetical protein